MPERAWSLARQNSGADAVSAAAAAAGKRPSLKIVPGGGSAPPGHRRVWVKKRGTAHATSVIVDPDELVDDLKTKVLNRFPTTLLRTCDPADLVFSLPEEIAKQVRAVSPSSSTARKWTASSQNQPQSAVDNLHATWQSPTATASAPTTAATEGRFTPATTPGSSGGPPLTPGRSVDLPPDEHIIPIIDRYFPHGMNIADAFEVHVVDSSVPAMPAVPIPPRPFKFRSNPPAPISRPVVSRINSSVEQQHQQQQQQPQLQSSPLQQTPTSTTPTSVQVPHIPVSHTNRSASRSRSISQSRGRQRERPSPKIVEKGEITTHTKDSGVLLLPRQFKLTGDSLQKEEGDDTSEIHEIHLHSIPATSEQQQPPPHPIQTNFTQPPEQMPLQLNNKSLEDIDCTLTHLSPRVRAENEKAIVPQINVLIVEDNVINQKILEAFMKRKNVWYGVAKNGKEAVSMWRQGGFHLILMDIQLPVMTGLEATKEIRRLEVKNRIGAFSHAEADVGEKLKEDELVGPVRSPVIIVALTASSASKDKSEALAAGCNDFLTKPVNLLWLEQKIVEWGCMQALIDFDGWKQWIRKSLGDGASTPSPATSMTSSTTAPPPMVTESH